MPLDLEAQNLSIAISDVEGRLLLSGPGARTVTLSPNDTRLPFILSASTTQADQPDADVIGCSRSD